ncbi:His/Gly/Thr/Pro-type tRNA ligase C-terminal domain-containing protein, partial [Metamycoplasma equirhinis]
PKVHELALNIKSVLEKANFNVQIDNSDKGAGFKAANSEIHGTPLRIEIGPRDLLENRTLFVRRDTLEKFYVPISEVKTAAKNIL